MFLSASPRETLSRGEQNALCPAGPVIKCFVIPPYSKVEKTAMKSFARFTPAGSQMCRGFKERGNI